MPVIVVGLFLLFFFLVSLTAALKKSPTFDESVHLYAGYSYLKWGDYRVNPEHPPLAKLLAAVPLMTLNLETRSVSPTARDLVQQNTFYGWGLANRFIYVDNDAETLFFYSRLVMIALALTLGLSVFFWTRELYGFEAAIIALFLYCFDPNILAHSSIVQTDIPFAVFFFTSTYFFWRSLNELTWFNLMMMALLFALATITKFSFLAILPIWIVLGGVKVVTSESFRSRITSPSIIAGHGKKCVLLSSVLLCAMVTAYLTIWTVYQFRFDAVALQRGQLPIDDLSASGAWTQLLLRLSLDFFILPEALVSGLSAAYTSIERAAYLLGEISNNGFLAYFPIAFLVKTPLPVVLLVLSAAAWTLSGRNTRDAYFLLIPAVVFFLLAVLSRMNIGLRHILPIYPFLFVWLGGVAGSMWRSGRRLGKCFPVFCLIWLAAGTAATYPNYLAFFNEFATAPKKAIEFLVDSNLDWGQDLKELKKWMNANSIGTIQLAYFGTAEPSYYGIDAVYLPGTTLPSGPTLSSLSPKTGYVAISATHLVGLYLDDRDTYSEFRNLEPVTIIGNSIWVYRLKY